MCKIFLYTQTQTKSLKMVVIKMSKVTLYHGTTHDFKKIEVHKGKPFKDLYA